MQHLTNQPSLHAASLPNHHSASLPSLLPSLLPSHARSAAPLPGVGGVGSSPGVGDWGRSAQRDGFAAPVERAVSDAALKPSP